MKIRKQIGNLGKDKLQQIVEAFINDLEEGAVAILEYFEEIENPEFLEVELDSENRILSFISKDGSHYIHNLRSETIEILTKRIEYLEEAPGIRSFEISKDPEGRSEVTIDKHNRIVSFRDENGVLHEPSGIITKLLQALNIKANRIETDSFSLPSDTQEEVTEIVNECISGFVTPKQPYLPKFGKVILTEETYYLTANPGYSDRSGVVLVKVRNSTSGLNIPAFFYVKDSTLTGHGADGNSYTGDLVTCIGEKYYVTATLVDGHVVESSVEVTFDSNSIAESSTQLTFYVAKDCMKLNSKFYVTSTLTKNTDPETGVVSYEVNENSIEVTKITGVPPYLAWTVDKNIEHYCLVDIDFGEFYQKNNVPVSIKYQGSGSLGNAKKNLRLTFYKKNDYKKKDKIKIGEMVRLSGFNMKSYGSEGTRVVDPILSYLMIDIWETRGEDAYPWNKETPYSGATGFIKSFPIETWFGDEFYGLQIFSLKKDEKNYLLDGDHDASGIFVSGDINSTTSWTAASARDWEDEFDADDKVPAYDDLPDGRESVSVETAAALNEFFKYTKGFVNGEIEIDGATVPFEKSMLEERIDLKGWIDYWICMQCFLTWDNTYHNMILYSGPDKKKMYAFFYDLDQSLQENYGGDCVDIIDMATNPDHHPSYVILDMSFWQKFIDEYKDQIINRYAYLRKTVLTLNNIESIYNFMVDNIPADVLQKESSRWGGNPKAFKNKITHYFKDRFEWLDNTSFNLK